MIIWFFSLLTMVIFKEDEPPIRSVTLLIKGLLHIARVMVSAIVSSHDMLGVCGARCGLWLIRWEGRRSRVHPRSVAKTEMTEGQMCLYSSPIQ